MVEQLGIQTTTSVVNQSNTDTNTATPLKIRLIWEEIELAESYLVCEMFEEAISSASGVIKSLHDKDSINGVEDAEFVDMLQAAGMVLVQSLEKLGRTLEIFNELNQLYGQQLVAIPDQVLLVGACFYMYKDPHGAQKLLEDYLSKWVLVKDQYHVHETNDSFMKECSTLSTLEVTSYLQVVEAYMTLLTCMLRDTNRAISWVEKASLPDHARQELLRRLLSMKSSNDMGTTSSTSASQADANVTSSLKREGRKEVDADDAAKQAIIRYSGQNVSTFWWFRRINLKFGSLRLAVSNGSILLTTLALLTYLYMRRKKYTISSSRDLIDKYEKLRGLRVEIKNGRAAKCKRGQPNGRKMQFVTITVIP